MTNKVRSFLTLAAIFFLTNFTNAQIQKGKWISSAGIDVDINNGNSSSPAQAEKTSSFGFSLEQGYFISSNFSIGMGASYLERKRNTNRETGSYIKDKSNIIGFFVYGQYYVKIKGKFYYSPSILFDYSKDKGRGEEKDPIFNPVVSSYNIDNYGIRLNPSQFTFSLSNKVLLESGLGYFIYGKRSGTTTYPLETINGSSTAFKMNFSPFITNIKISLLF